MAYLDDLWNKTRDGVARESSNLGSSWQDFTKAPAATLSSSWEHFSDVLSNDRDAQIAALIAAAIITGGASGAFSAGAAGGTAAGATGATAAGTSGLANAAALGTGAAGMAAGAGAAGAGATGATALGSTAAGATAAGATGAAAAGSGGTASWVQAILPSILSGVLGGNSSDAAGKGAAQADPFASQRPQYQQMLSQLLTNPDSYSLSPGAKFAQEQGLEATQAAFASRGLSNSSAEQYALTKYATGVASQDYTKTLELLGNLAGANTGAPGAAGQITYGQGQTNAQNQSAGVNALLSQLFKQFGQQENGGDTQDSFTGNSLV